MKYTSWENDEYEFFCRGLDFAEAIDGAALSLSDLKKRAKLLSDHKSKSHLAISIYPAGLIIWFFVIVTRTLTRPGADVYFK